MLNELTPEQRERIYREEKAARENGSGGGSSHLLLYLTLGAIAGLAVALYITQKVENNEEPSLDDFRKAYPGLSPEEEE